MKSSDNLIRCPVCRELVSKDGIKIHISVRARIENKKSRFGIKHLIYKENEQKTKTRKI